MGDIPGPGTVASRVAGFSAADVPTHPTVLGRAPLRSAPLRPALLRPAVLSVVVPLAAGLLLLTGCTNRATESQSAASYALPPVSAADTARTVTYLRGSGVPLLGMHRSAAAVALGYTDDGCRALTALISPQNQDGVVQAAIAVPDAVLNQLALAEIHAIATMRACNSNTSTKQLTSVDALLTKRFVQLGVLS
ncbi:hypothetical protein SAMN05444157_1772 [Frankineae bacterium MT45]|nr:hypothetical protein SAMN05444157_1772 [Frankineae bacterium MT45]